MVVGSVTFGAGLWWIILGGLLLGLLGLVVFSLLVVASDADDAQEAELEALRRWDALGEVADDPGLFDWRQAA